MKRYNFKIWCPYCDRKVEISHEYHSDSEFIESLLINAVFNAYCPKCHEPIAYNLGIGISIDKVKKGETLA